MIKIIRCDERLIHGQCMQFIVPDYDIRNIIVVDDATATNSMLKSIFAYAVPKTIKTEVYTTADSIPVIAEAIGDDSSTLLLMKHPRTLVEIRKQVKGLPDSVNIGAQMAKNGVKCVEYATLDPLDVEACKTMEAEGVRVYFNAIGVNGKVVEFSSLNL
jgi:mannose/fructose/N-acetylgalactosamine-specific phosphotransferase system component IIB